MLWNGFVSEISSTEMKFIGGMIIGELSRLWSISSMFLFFAINITQIEASVKLFAFCCFNIKISWKSLEKHCLLNFTKTDFYILFCNRVPFIPLRIYHVTDSLIKTGHENSVGRRIMYWIHRTQVWDSEGMVNFLLDFSLHSIRIEHSLFVWKIGKRLHIRA